MVRKAGEKPAGEGVMLMGARAHVREYMNKFIRLSERDGEKEESEKLQLWSIGIYSGKDPWSLEPVKKINPVLTRRDVKDVQALFIADPFMIRVGETWFMFFEMWNVKNGKGEIGLASSGDGRKWTYQQRVLAEPFHLSYPYVFQWEDEYYMIPESHQANDIRLYKAADFPVSWTLVGMIISGHRFADASIFRHDEKWWLLTETNPEMKHDTLRLYSSPALGGPWQEHPQSPVISGNPHIARPAGRVLKVDGKIIRFAQDCFPVYGIRVRAFAIEELTEHSYRERQIGEQAVLQPSGKGWNQGGMHHLDAHIRDDGSWIACVDGWKFVSPSGQ